MQSTAKPMAIVALLAVTACGTVMKGQSDNIALSTNPPSYSNCTLKNARGTVNANIPAMVTVQKSRTDLDIVCIDQTTGARGQAKIASDVEPWAFGNLLTAGLGLGVDWATGAAYDYPEHVNVTVVTSMPVQAPAPGAPGYFAPAADMPTAPAPAPVYMAPAMPAQPSPMAPLPGTSSPVPAQPTYR